MAWMKGNYGNYGRKVFPVESRGVEFTGNMNVKDTTGGSRVLTITGLCTGAVEVTQGALNVQLSRAPSHPMTSAAWGGAEDIAARISGGNYAANTSAYGGMKVLRVYARNYAGAQLCNMQAAEISWDDRGSGGGNGISVANGYGLLVTTRPNGVVGTTMHTVVIEDSGQGTVSPTFYNNSLLHFRTSGNRASGAIPAAISFEKQTSTSGMDAVMAFKGATGEEGATLYAGTIAGSGNCIRLKVYVNGIAYYIIGYATVDH
jgi:hypothetical protein